MRLVNPHMHAGVQSTAKLRRGAQLNWVHTTEQQQEPFLPRYTLNQIY
jgi:hypothetical protein